MSTGIIELNDAGLRVGSTERAEQVLSESVGLAVLDGQDLLLGSAALAQSRLHPLHSNSLFWHRLGTEPLPFQSASYRHHADLAYSQLLSLHQSIPQCEQIIFALPATYTREQMSLLLGIVDQCSFQAVGLVDSAVVASAPYARRERLLHLDIQLHQCVLTELQVADGQLSGTRVDILSGLGLLAFWDRWAKVIADQFVEQCRFDPLHSASSEQSLYDQLPTWMAAYEDGSELFMEVSGKSIKLARELFIQAVNPLYEQINHRVEQLTDSNSQLLVTDRLTALPGFSDVLSNESLSDRTDAVDKLPPSAVIQGVHRYADAIIQDGGPLSFSRMLPVEKISEAPQEVPVSTSNAESTSAPRSLHLLIGHTAYPVNAAPLYLNLDRSQLVARDSDAHCSVQQQDSGLLLIPLRETPIPVRKVKQDEQLVHDNCLLLPGDQVGGIKLIEVLQGHGAP